MEARFLIYIFIILIAHPPKLPAQIFMQDEWFHRSKFEHFAVSMTFTPAPIRVLEDFKVKHPEIKGAALMFSVGVAKEFLYDPQPSYKDIAFNAAGCIAGFYLNRLYSDIEKNRKRKRMEKYLPFYDRTR